MATRTAKTKAKIPARRPTPKQRLIATARQPSVDRKEAVFKLFAMGLSLPEIARKIDTPYADVWKEIKSYADHLDKTNPLPQRLVIHQQYVMLTRIADKAMEAWERSVERGTVTQTVETSEYGGIKKGIPASKNTGKRQHLTPGEAEYLRIAMEAGREIRQLFGLGAEGGGSGGGSIEAMLIAGGAGVKIKTSWGTPAEYGIVPGPNEQAVLAGPNEPEYMAPRPVHDDDEDITSDVHAGAGLEVDLDKVPR